MLAEQGEPGEQDPSRKQDLPEVKWVSEAEGTRATGVLERTNPKYPGHLRAP